MTPALLILSEKGQLLFAQSYSHANMITNCAATEAEATLLGSKSDRLSFTTSSVLSYSPVFIKFRFCKY